MIAKTVCRVLGLTIEKEHDHETKKASERSIVMKVKNGVKENIAVETEKMNKRTGRCRPICCER